jgi:type II secretory pathway component PulC
LVTPIPEPKQPTISLPPEPKKQDFIAALTITVKGIIIGDDEAKNVTMIEDETKKEGLYHLGDKIKDAQIIKIARNRIVFLRANGQQEIFFLRKDDPLLEPETDEKWNYIIKKTGDNSFEIDPFNFAHEVESLGNFIERISVIGTASQNGSPVGVRIGELEKDELGTRLGLEKNDIIVSINQFATADLKNRLSLYDKITAMNLNDSITAKVNRSGKDVILNYKLSTISKAKKRTFTAEPAPKQQPLKMSNNQEREKNVREFENRHGETRNQQEAIAAIRQRLMQNLRTRLQDTRTR